MNTDSLSVDSSQLARTVAPEDLCCGDVVGILSVVCEFPPFFCEPDCLSSDRGEPVRMRFRPQDGGIPLKVKAICLPFVLLKSPDGKVRSLDVRQVEFARLSPPYGKQAWKDWKAQLKQEEGETSRPSGRRGRG